MKSFEVFLNGTEAEGEGAAAGGEGGGDKVTSVDKVETSGVEIHKYVLSSDNSLQKTKL